MAVIQCNFFSYTLGIPVDIQVILPSLAPTDLDEPGPWSHEVREKYPVVYLLHGHYNDYLGWSKLTSMPRYTEERRIAAVCCSVGNKWYLKDSLGMDYYTFVTKELREFVEANFPISRRSEDRYIAGLSMGGYGALSIGMGNPADYRAIGAFSPGLGAGVEELIQKEVGFPLPDDKNPAYLAKQAKKEKTALPELFLCIGREDFLYNDVSAFHSLLEELEIPHRYDDEEGFAHEWPFWDLKLLEFLEWIPRTDIYAGMPLHKM